MDLVSLTCAGSLCVTSVFGAKLVSKDPDFPVPVQVQCIAENIYHEARGEPSQGQLATVAVVLNRMKSPRFAKDACRVIYQPKQFSWTSTQHHQPSLSEIARAYSMTVAALQSDPTNGADHYYADYVNPAWSRSPTMSQKTKIGRHIFMAAQ